MNMKVRMAAVACLTVAAGVFAYMRPHNTLPSDFRDAVGSGNSITQLQDSLPPGSDKDASPVPSAPTPAGKEIYLDIVSGRHVEICENISENEVKVSENCSSWFTGKYLRKRAEITRRVHAYDGLVDGFKEYVMVSSKLMRVYRLYENGIALLDDPTGDGAGYYQVSVNKLEREVPAEESWNGLKKGGTVCLKQDYEFDEETAESGLGGLFKPFPYFGKKGSKLVIENLFKSGFARMRTVSKQDERTLLRPVALGLVEPCVKE